MPINLSLGVIIDKCGGLFHISKNNVGNIRDLQLLVSGGGKWLSLVYLYFGAQNLPPVSCVSVGVCSTRNNFVAVVAKKQVLMPAILRCDMAAVQNIFDHLKGEQL